MSKKQDKNEIEEEQEVTLDNESQVNLEEFEAMQTELQTLKEQLEGVDSKFKRALADYQNLEKRIAEGRSEMSTWATSELLKKLLLVLNYYDQALSGVSADERGSGWFKGVEMATVQFRNVLKEEGLEEIDTNGDFDHELHEAVDTTPGEDGKILKVLEKGYKLHGKVLKPSRVVVGKKGD